MPEVVTVDNEGFKGVAYARTTAIIAEALKELKRETDEKLDAILTELSALRHEISVLKSREIA